LKVVKELLFECATSPSENLFKHKEAVKTAGLFVIIGVKAEDVNIYMLNHVRDYLIDDCLPTLFNLC
jgi:hypothetical protein